MANGNGDWGSALRWVPVIVVLASVFMAWGQISTRIDVMADEIVELKDEDSGHNEREAEGKQKVAVLEANQEAIKEDVAEIKREQKAFRKEVDEKLDRVLEELRNQ